MIGTRTRQIALLVTLTAWACGGENEEADERDLSLPPAEAVTAINDQPEDSADMAAPEAPAATPQSNPPASPAPAARAPAAPAPAPRGLPAGTQFIAYAADTLTSRHNEVGQPAMAVIMDDIAGTDGRVVVPSGAVLLGTITDLAPAETPGGQGRMVVTYTRLEFGGNSYGISLTTDSMATHMKGRGVTAGDAAKVGAGAVVGAIAGRVIGGNARGTAVGAAAGAAAGVGIAAATRDVDILLDAGAPIYLALAEAFQLVPIQ